MNSCVRGKLAERQGRKAEGLRCKRIMTAWLPLKLRTKPALFAAGFLLNKKGYPPNKKNVSLAGDFSCLKTCPFKLAGLEGFSHASKQFSETMGGAATIL